MRIPRPALFATLTAALAGLPAQQPASQQPQAQQPTPTTPTSEAAEVAPSATAATTAKPTEEQGKPTQLEQLTRDVDAAHHPDGPVAPIHAFRCNLELRLTDRTAENAGQVDLSVMFLLWREPEARKARPLIRYTVRSGDQPIERGRDLNGPWQLLRGEPTSLEGAQLKTDLEQCERHTKLARQLLRFLSPGDVLRDIKDAVVSPGEFRVDRATRVPCWTIRGQSARFPLLQTAGEDAAVQLEVHVDKASHRLIAVDVWPLVDDKPVAERGERILLEQMHVRDGVLVPHRLVHLFRDAEGVPRPQTVASLTRIELRPELTPDDFDRGR